MTDAKATRRRRSRGTAWYWSQTDSWYFTPPGTKRRVRLLDEDQRPIRGAENRQAAELALARVKVAGNWRPTPDGPDNEGWVVAKVCSTFIEHCDRRVEHGTISREYRDEVTRYLNDLCGYCGRLSVSELRKGHVQHWVESRSTWGSSATQRSAITIVLAAFNFAREMHDIPHTLRGMKKPSQKPRLHSLDPDDEQLMYSVTDEPFRNFLFAAIHTGLRPFCELARLTTEDVEETERGMMWRVYSSKTQKTRKIPIRSEVADLVRGLLGTTPWDSSRTLFQNPQGNPWKKVTGVSRFRKIRIKLGWDRDSVRKNYSCYSCRHTFAHRMLAGYWTEGAGCSIEVLAELMGDTPKVAFDHYGREWGQNYQDPLWAAIGAG